MFMLEGRLPKKTKEKQKGFVPAWPPLNCDPRSLPDSSFPPPFSRSAWSRYFYKSCPLGRPLWESHLQAFMDCMILRLIYDQIGLLNDGNARPWLCPATLHNIRFELDQDSETPSGGDNVPVFWRVRESFHEARHELTKRDSRIFGARLYEELTLPVACAFVHRTAWTSKLLEFKRQYGAWRHIVEKLVCEYCSEHWLADDIYEYALSVWIDNPDSHMFWRGFHSTQQDLLCQQFFLTLDFYTSKLLHLIEVLDEAFSNINPATFDILLSRRTWELLVLEWIHGEEKEAFLFFYATRGELACCIDHIAPQGTFGFERWARLPRLSQQVSFKVKYRSRRPGSESR